MKKLMAQYLEYTARVKASGAKFLKFKCPHCSGEIETQRATRGDTWDSMTTCPHCEKMFYRSNTHYSVKTYTGSGV